MRHQARYWSLRVAGILFLPWGLMLAGCGESRGTVSGKVSYLGQPLKGGTVSIIPKAGGIKSSPIEEDGSYSISQLPPGPATITVETASIRPAPRGALPGPYAKMPKDAGAKIPGAAQQGDEKRYVPIPERYANPEGSELSLDVKSGPQDHNIDLK